MLKARIRGIVIYVVDILIALFSFGLAYSFEQKTLSIAFDRKLLFICLLISGATLFLFLLFRINSTIWRYSTEKDYVRLFVFAFFAGGITSILCDVSYLVDFTWRYHVLAALFNACISTASRIFYKMLFTMKHASDNKKSAPDSDAGKKRLLIVGAGTAGYVMIGDIRSNPSCDYNPVALVDDDPQKIGRNVNGVRVVGGIGQISEVCAANKVDLIIVAIPSATNEQRAKILEECAKANCPVKILPHFTEFSVDEESNFINRVRDITPEELLGREPIPVANETVYEFISGKVVAVTGGGGSIGSEICRQIAAHDPKRLVIIDIYENNAYEIQQELINKYGASLDLKVFIASVREQKKISELFAKEKPQIVFHAAAHKHVPLMEVSPDEAVKNNIFGTYNTALAARENGVERFILISTDKAVNPTNIMGATKRVCEMIIQYFESTSPDTSYAAVRFGNVLGSNGSVIPLFKEQIKNRQDVTITHPDIIRYFMTIPEASQLVLTAGAMAKGSEIFVLDMGEPVKILDLAKKMISLSGLRLGEDINIRYIGLRPGEKLYEELLMGEEGLKNTLNEKIFISSVAPIEFDRLTAGLDSLRELVNNPAVTPQEIENALMKIVPTFKRYVPNT